jgi:hypothetical protein
MPRYWFLFVAVAAWLTGLAPADAQPAPPPQPQQPPQQVRPCAAVRMTCEQAGFVRQGRRDGLGIVTDCIRPIMTGTPQRKRAARPLPAIDPAIVAACKARNPNYGLPRTQRSGPPTAPGAAPPGTAPGMAQPGTPPDDEAPPEDEPPQPQPKR